MGCGMGCLMGTGIGCLIGCGCSLGCGFGGYCVLYPLTVWLGPKLSPACASMDKRGQLEWASYIPSTVNASLIAIAASRHVLNSSVSSSTSCSVSRSSACASTTGASRASCLARSVV